MFSNDTSFNFLNSEAATASGMLSSGLALLRKLDFTKETYFYQALFSLSIGLERLMKLIAIYDYRYKNDGEMPKNNYLRDLSHNLEKLFRNTRCISNECGVGNFNDFDNDLIYQAILKILSDFAQKTRYYNLDMVTSDFGAYNEEHPFVEWEKKINGEIVNRHFDFNKKSASRLVLYDLSASKTEDERVTMSTINNFQSLYYEGQFIEVKAKYSMYYMYSIIRMICEVLHARQLYLLPILSDHFRVFLNTDKSYILARKTWDNYKL